VPPLRERREDIAVLAESDPGPARLRPTTRPRPTLHADAPIRLARYPFPGNVRELENILERAFALSDGDGIRAADLRLPASRPAAAARQCTASPRAPPTGHASPSRPM
jgi:two-component system response regulator PilR (NtrC family)